MSMLAARLAARLHGRRGLTWLRERHAECPESEVCTRRLPLWCGGTRGWVVTTRSRPTEYGASTREVGNSKPGNRSSLGPWSHDPAPRPTAPQRRHASDELPTQDTSLVAQHEIEVEQVRVGGSGDEQVAAPPRRPARRGGGLARGPRRGAAPAPPAAGRGPRVDERPGRVGRPVRAVG